MATGLYNKYFGDPAEADLYGGPVQGYDDRGFPFVGAHPGFLKQDELEAVPIATNFCVAWFRLWDADDLAKYKRVMDHVVNNKFFIHRRLDVPVPDFPADEPGGSLKVYLEWTQPVAVSPRPGPPA